MSTLPDSDPQVILDERGGWTRDYLRLTWVRALDDGTTLHVTDEWLWLSIYRPEQLPPYEVDARMRDELRALGKLWQRGIVHATGDGALDYSPDIDVDRRVQRGRVELRRAGPNSQSVAAVHPGTWTALLHGRDIDRRLRHVLDLLVRDAYRDLDAAARRL